MQCMAEFIIPLTVGKIDRKHNHHRTHVFVMRATILFLPDHFRTAAKQSRMSVMHFRLCRSTAERLCITNDSSQRTVRIRCVEITIEHSRTILQDFICLI